MSKLFEDFDTISEKEWKNKVQVELKGLEYNETLVWGTNDQINVKPLYTKDDVDYSQIQPLPRSSKDWKIISKYSENKDQDYSFLYGYFSRKKLRIPNLRQARNSIKCEQRSRLNLNKTNFGATILPLWGATLRKSRKNFYLCR